MSSSLIKLGDISLVSSVMNAAGPWAATFADLKNLSLSNSSAVVTKSFSLKPLKGNEKPNVYFSQDFSINSVGLENKGANYFIESLSKIDKRKPFISSLVAKDLKEFERLILRVNNSRFDLFELNLSCPNFSSEAPLGYYPKEVEALLKMVFKIAKKPVAVKLPPYYSRSFVENIAKILLKFPVNHLVLINTLPLASTPSENGKPTIKANKGIGSLGGSYLKPVALAHVKLFSEYTSRKIPLVGVGGIKTKKDIEDYLNFGATAVQVGSAINNFGVKIFDSLI